jgi:predicted nucleic acid-binding protein
VAAGRQETTHEWWKGCLDKFEVFVSPTVLEEVAEGDEEAAQRRLDLIRGFHVLKATSQVDILAAEYVKNGIVPGTNPDDAYHLAFASIYEIDILATWNFKHLANVFVIRKLLRFNFKKGIRTPLICSPEELLGE